FGTVDGKWRLVTKINDPGLASITAPAWHPVAQPSVPPSSINIRLDLTSSLARVRPLKGSSGRMALRMECSGLEGQNADRDHEQRWCADLSMFPGCKEKATG